MTAVASFGPMPGTASSSALGASSIASEEPNRSISAWYVFVPIPWSCADAGVPQILSMFTSYVDNQDFRCPERYHDIPFFNKEFDDICVEVIFFSLVSYDFQCFW